MDIITYGLLNKKIKQKADLDSPHFTGEPTAPTPDYPDNSERLATTEYVNEAVAGAGGGITYQLSRTGKILRLSGSDSSVSEAELPYTCMTTAEWEEQPPTVSEPGALYIWSDYRVNDQGENVCGIKIGDGNAYVGDLPFQDEDILRHILNTDIHVTAAEKEFWNNKVTCYISQDNPTTVIFTKENIIGLEGGNN